MQTDKNHRKKASSGLSKHSVRVGFKPMPAFMRQQLSSGIPGPARRSETGISRVVRKRLRSINLRPFYTGRYDQRGYNIPVSSAVEIECTL